MYFPHKNHKLIIDSLKIINFNKKENVSAVFCGFDKGYLQNLKEYSKIIKIDEKVLFFEFVIVMTCVVRGTYTHSPVRLNTTLHPFKTPTMP